MGVLETFFTENGIEYDTAHVSTWRNHEQIKGRSRSDKKKKFYVTNRKMLWELKLLMT